ncbi:MAG: hypothetical protein A4E55_02075 [Pelotomaculum sp. PtaU1.Bin035]|nr:MAG: hypothetical protein A4E55_02075 [Pelotomaculum sp. PtaU1.Bin035]
MKLKVLKKILPSSYTLNTAQKPMHAGEIFYLWDALTASYQVVNIGETYYMNTQDRDIHIFLKGLVEGIQLFRIPKIENLLKDAGFAVPPRPATKTLQGKPGVGQDVKLSDEEVLKVLLTLAHSLLVLDARGVGIATTNEAIRGVFIDLLKKTIIAHEALMQLGSGRQAFTPPPPATASPGALNLGEAYWLWDQLGNRHSTIVLLETYISNTKDTELIKELEYGLYKVAFPQLEKLEMILKNEGFTVPARPVSRIKRQHAGRTGKIIVRDSEVLSIVITATQVNLDMHMNALGSAYREDVRELLKSFVFEDIDYLAKLIKLGNKRDLMEYPPKVTAKV